MCLHTTSACSSVRAWLEIWDLWGGWPELQSQLFKSGKLCDSENRSETWVWHLRKKKIVRTFSNVVLMANSKVIQTGGISFAKAQYCPEEVSLGRSEKWAGRCWKTDYLPRHPDATTYLIGLASGHFLLWSHKGTLIASQMRQTNNGPHSPAITEASVRREAVAATFPQQALIKKDARQIIS